MANTQLVKIMIVDDHPAIVEGLCGFLQTISKFKVIAIAKHAEAARHGMQNNEVDLVIMDICLPEIEGSSTRIIGIELTAELRNLYQDLPILIYSSTGNAELASRAKDAGARGYLLKGADLSVIKQAIEIIMGGWTYLDPALGPIPKPRWALGPPELTKREDEVMRLFAHWLTTKEVSRKLGISVSAVKSHRNNIISKLDINNAPGLYREAIRRYGNPDEREAQT